jgi:sulfur-oxidizing protein SoxX
LRIAETKSIKYLLAGPAVALALAWGLSGAAEHPGGATKEQLAAGRELAMTRNKGNCLACHAIDDGELPGNIGPPLKFMQQRFPDRAKLREQVWDPTARNPDTIMPPFGKYGILSDQEIDLIVDYIHTL